MIEPASTSEDIPNDKFYKPDMSDVPDDKDNAVVTVDLLDIVHNKKKDKKEGTHKFGLAGESSRLELVETRQDQEKDGVREEEMKSPEKKKSIKKGNKEMPFSTDEGNASGCSSGYCDKRSQPETSPIGPIAPMAPIAPTRCQHSTGSVMVDIEDMVVEDLPPTQSWSRLFNWDDFGYSLILGFAPTAWDVYSDLTIAEELRKSGDSISAGLSYLFICF